ncbi:gamma-glutamylcyclotransferase [Kordia sp. YSTF-M3]|uniref:Gamma-glutamylcyclotransferase n=1 Tax=Kordia aestuariivivens TaxID=2759037 RepID=A0ABR7QF23_9FLAO|nr:gamma-glutamylcyclotransferase family protein [Kordia aestuariivivens]MBC8757165.1 gamma-glutamylcyclotransferase [Kordia aestuariivivens]
MSHYLFSYGTLQLENVQLESFGRILIGKKDTLVAYKLEQLQITDEAVLAVSDQKFHPIAIQTNSTSDVISGTLYKITQEELAEADRYEVADYKRVEATFQSGNKGWIYVKA